MAKPYTLFDAAFEALGLLFAKFTQADASTTRRFGGSGLGLSICRELAELMRGTIVAESRPGEGSCFTLTVPLARLGEPGSVVTRDAGPAEALPAIRVLAAEDNAVNQLVLRTLLQQIGVDPVVVDNGAAAIEAWKTGAFDLILMDVQMPVMDGPTAAGSIREIERATGRARTPIIALTANAMAHQVEAHRASGMDGHAAKPIEAQRLYEAVAMALDGVEAGAEIAA